MTARSALIAERCATSRALALREVVHLCVVGAIADSGDDPELLNAAIRVFIEALIVLGATADEVSQALVTERLILDTTQTQ